MTALDPGPVSNLTPVIPSHPAVTDALHHAVRRDLDRLIRVLAQPVTAVRRSALIAHVGFVLDQLAEHHRLLDEVRWPAVLTVRPDLAAIADRVADAHRELVAHVHPVRYAAHEWRTDPQQRPQVHAAVRQLADALAPVLDQDGELAPLVEEILAAAPATHPPARRARPSAPTTLARRTFWLLDELAADRAERLTDRTPRAVMWILRNGFSGAYNRSAYLMWVGGGTGPAV